MPRARARLTAIALAGLSACARLAPVAHDPWIEDRSLELTAEELVLEVGPRDVRVDARFAFTPRGDARAHAMAFAVAARGGSARDFTAELWGEPGHVTRLPSTVGSAAGLPIAAVGETRDFETPAGAFGRPGTWLRVRYSQPAKDGFDYVLRSGAYWAGPIGKLAVVVRDPTRRVVSATVEGRGPDHRESDALTWQFTDLEPREAIRLTLR